MKLFGWLHGGTRKTTDAAAVRPVSGRTPETDVERMARHRRAWAVEQAQREVERQQQAEREAAAQQARAEREREWIAAVMTRHGGVYFPGDQPELPRAAPVAWLGSGGIEREADYDWRARVDEAQQQDIEAGGRGPEP